MRRVLFLCLLALAMQGPYAFSQQTGPYKVLRTVKVGGDGGFDYVYADSEGRRLYIPRTGATPRISVYDLDTLQPVGEIPNVNARGAATDPVSHRGFVSSKPVVMFDSTKLTPAGRPIDVDGQPDGILVDAFSQRVFVFSHRAPNVTVLDSRDGQLVGTLDLGGAPEQAVADGKGHVYVDIEDKDNIAAIDVARMKVTAHYELGGKGGGPGGLAMDTKNRILFAACHDPATMVILNADSGKILATLPIGTGVDGAGFNPNTMEAFSSQGDGTLTVIKENGPTGFAVAQTVQTMRGAKTMTIDTKTNHVLLIAAEFGPAPPPPAGGGRGPRPPMLPDSFTIIEVGK